MTRRGRVRPDATNLRTCGRHGDAAQPRRRPCRGEVCPSTQMRAYMLACASIIAKPIEARREQSRRLHARRSLQPSKVADSGASNLRRLHEGSEDCRLFARATFTNVVRFRRDIVALRHDCKSEQSWPMPDNQPFLRRPSPGGRAGGVSPCCSTHLLGGRTPVQKRARPRLSRAFAAVPTKLSGRPEGLSASDD